MPLPGAARAFTAPSHSVTLRHTPVTPSRCHTQQVLKWAKPLPGAARAFRREWVLGRRLTAAAQQDPALRILLQTGALVCGRACAVCRCVAAWAGVRCRDAAVWHTHSTAQHSTAPQTPQTTCVRVWLMRLHHVQALPWCPAAPAAPAAARAAAPATASCFVARCLRGCRAAVWTSGWRRTPALQTWTT
jgi:hypothetical protein